MMNDARFLTRDRIRIRGLDVPEGERLKEQLINLILAVRGTIPGSRGFGLPWEFVDWPYPAASNMMAIELSEAVDIWIPRLSILSVRFSSDEPEGLMFADITVEVEDG